MNRKFPVWLKYATLSAVFIVEREVEIRVTPRGKVRQGILKVIRLYQGINNKKPECYPCSTKYSTMKSFNFILDFNPNLVNMIN